MELEEYNILANFHQTMEKEHQKALHSKHIKSKTFTKGDMVLLYDNKYLKYPRNL
jgi:hypothetical protein